MVENQAVQRAPGRYQTPDALPLERLGGCMGLQSDSSYRVYVFCEHEPSKKMSMWAIAMYINATSKAKYEISCAHAILVSSDPSPSSSFIPKCMTDLHSKCG